MILYIRTRNKYITQINVIKCKWRVQLLLYSIGGKTAV